MIRKILARRLLGIALLAAVVFGIAVLFPASIQSQKPFASANVAYAQTPAPATKPLTYQCVGTGVYIATKGCTERQNVLGGTALTIIKRTLPSFDAAKKKGDVNKQVSIANEIVEQLKILEYPYSGDPIAAARILVTKDVPRQEADASNVTCTALSFFSATCWLRIISVVIGSLLVSISSWLLALADMLFRWTVDNTILLFASEIFDKVKDGVNAGWTAMRDIANIVIIGMFTFLAISTILSIEEYGAKKLLARVLVIAVIINFSLVFTKIIIDASNFTAGQFYASASGVPLSTARDDAAIRDKGGVPVKETDGLFSFRNQGFSGAFLNFMKITSVGDTTGALWAKAEQQGNWSALAHGILSALVILGAAGVLFYGAYLLLLRAVLFIFLMITAAGAFATHLIPAIDGNTYGWKGWWSSLLHNAALAPLLMIFLWITLSVSSTMTSMNGGTLGNLASPTKPGSSDVGVLFSYLIILGLLFASFKLSSKWAGKVGGLNFTGTMLKTAAVGTAAIASRFVAAPILRQTVGRAATQRSFKLTQDIKDKTEAAAKMGDKHPDYAKTQKEIYDLKRQQRYVDKAAKGSFNLGNVGVVNAGAKMLKVPGIVSGQVAQKKPQGFQGAMDERIKKEMEDAEKLVRKPREVEKTLMDAKMQSAEHAQNMAAIANEKTGATSDFLTAQADRKVLDEPNGLKEQRDVAKQDKERAERALEIARQARDSQNPLVVQLATQQQQAQMTQAQAQQKAADIATTSQAEITRLDAIITGGKATPEAISDAMVAKASVEKQRDIDMTAQTTKINEATAATADLQQRIARIKQPLDAAVQTAQATVTGASQNVKQLDTQITDIEKAFTDARERLERAEGAEEKYENALQNEVRREAQAIVKGSGDIAVAYAATKVHQRWTNYIPREVFGQTEENDIVAKSMRKAAKTGILDINLKDQMKAWNALAGSGGGPATPPPTATPSNP